MTSAPEKCEAHGNPTPCIKCVTGTLHALAAQDSKPLAILGRERALISKLAKQIRREGVRGHALYPTIETPRGYRFDVLICEGTVGKPTGRVARVEITFHRIEES